LQPEEIYEALLEPDNWEDPYPLYAALHAHGAVLPIDDGLILVPGYQAVRSILSDARFLVDDAEIFDRVDDSWRGHPSLSRPNLLSLNGTEHSRLREPMSRRLTRQRVQSLVPAISAQIDRLLDELALAGADGSPVDLIEAFACALPVAIICELVGADEWDAATLRGLSRSLTAVVEPEIDDEMLAAGDAAALQLAEMCTELVADRRARARDDLVSDLVAAADAPSPRIGPQELIQNLILLATAGFECSMNLLGSGLRLAFTEPGIGEGLRSGQLEPARFVEELLRFEPPIQETGRRLAKPGEIDGIAVGSDDEIVLLLGAANRDPRRFADPDLFLPDRADSGSLSFGAGPHFCLGAGLARLQAELAFPRLLRRFPRLAPAGAPDRRPSAISRGFDRMPVSLGRRQS
jgi:cytochrome P450